VQRRARDRIEQGRGPLTRGERRFGAGPARPRGRAVRPKPPEGSYCRQPPGHRRTRGAGSPRLHAFERAYRIANERDPLYRHLEPTRTLHSPEHGADVAAWCLPVPATWDACRRAGRQGTRRCGRSGTAPRPGAHDVTGGSHQSDREGKVTDELFCLALRPRSSRSDHDYQSGQRLAAAPASLR